MSERVSVFISPEGQSRYFAAYDAAMELWPSPCESCLVPTPYGQAHVIVSGPEDGYPLVLLHGGYASSTMWFANVGDLSAKYRVLAVDTLGEPGKSLPMRQTASKPDCAAWLESVLDALGIARAHVMGLSRGGWLALNLAIQAPQRLEKIVLLSPAASFISLNAFFRGVVAVAMRFRSRAILRRAVYSWVARGFVIPQAFVEQFVTGLQYFDWTVSHTGYAGPMPSAFSDEELCSVRHPVLLLIGAQDQLNGSKTLERARSTLVNVETGVIPNSAHMLSMEQPAQIDSRVLEFLAAEA